MNGRACLTAAGVGLVLVGVARGQFKPGHLFVTDPAGHQCQKAEDFGWDRIWEVDPETGEVALFAELRDEWCGFIVDIAFTPDGERLRVASFFGHMILDLDSRGNVSVALDQNDGIFAPLWIAFDSEANFFVSQESSDSTIMRFPPNGAPPTVLASVSEGLPSFNAPITMGGDGYLYVGAGYELLRINPEGETSEFGVLAPDVRITSLASDHLGFVYVGFRTGEIERYVAGDSDSRQQLISDLCANSQSVDSLAVHPSKRLLYASCADRLWEIDLQNKEITALPEVPDVSYAILGIAPTPSRTVPVPGASDLGVIAIAFCFLTAGCFALGRRSRNAHIAEPLPVSTKNLPRCRRSQERTP